jgi:two-component system, sporulation sensor kinase E
MHRPGEYAETIKRKYVESHITEPHYRGLFENAKIALVVLDSKSGKILDANKQATELLDYTKDEFLLMDSLPLGEDETMISDILYTEMFFSGETRVKNKEGMNLNVQIHTVPIARTDDSLIVVCLREVSEEKKLRQRLNQMEQMTLLGRLAAGIAHEIRNPLAAVTLSLQYLARKYPAEHDITNTTVMAMEGAARIEQVIEKSLGLARATPPRRIENDLNGIVDQTLRLMKKQMQEKQIEVRFENALNLPAVSVDDNQIRQVILNILHNAVDASKENGIIEIRTYTDGEIRERNVCLDIRDFGPGIPDEIWSHLFELFVTTKKGVAGLGLALSRYIMDLHQASIEVETERGKGTTFRLKFPPYDTTNGH